MIRKKLAEVVSIVRMQLGEKIHFHYIGGSDLGMHMYRWYCHPDTQDIIAVHKDITRTFDKALGLSCEDRIGPTTVEPKKGEIVRLSQGYVATEPHEEP